MKKALFAVTVAVLLVVVLVPVAFAGDGNENNGPSDNAWFGQCHKAINQNAPGEISDGMSAHNPYRGTAWGKNLRDVSDGEIKGGLPAAMQYDEYCMKPVGCPCSEAGIEVPEPDWDCPDGSCPNPNK